MIDWKAVPYIIIWHVGKLFGFLSTLGSGFVIQETAPKALVGLWNGRNEALTNVASAIAPLMFSALYDEIGNKRGVEMLAATSIVSVFSVLAYVPIVGMLPKPIPEIKEDELKELSVYEAMSDQEYNQLPMAIQAQVEEMMTKAGKPTRVFSWGRYKDEFTTLSSLQDRAVSDFQFTQQFMIAMLTDQQLMKDNMAKYKKQNDLIPPVSRDEAKEQMGSWIADYMDDAGYENWETQSTFYKAMFMNSFPPIDKLDGRKPEYHSMSPGDLEEHMTRFLSIMDGHLAEAKRRVKTGSSAGSVLNLLHRR